jgi:hypothetical protein
MAGFLLFEADRLLLAVNAVTDPKEISSRRNISSDIKKLKMNTT